MAGKNLGGRQTNKLFVGWEVVSNPNDSTNREWWKEVDAIVLTDHAAVRIRSNFDRGVDWTVISYWDDPKDCEFGK
jgi:hypothetical protein